MIRYGIKGISAITAAAVMMAAAQPALAGVLDGIEYSMETGYDSARANDPSDVGKAVTKGAVMHGVTRVLPSKLTEAVDAAYDVGTAAVNGDMNTIAKQTAKSGAGYYVATSAPAIAVKIAGWLGVKASTGTAISALSGAAATKATFAAIGTATGLALASPAVIGGAVVAACAAGVGAGIKSGIDYFWK